MSRSLTNNFSLQYAIEDSLGVLPGSPEWNILEPNGINTYGANISTVARNPISKFRQRRKGTITDLDSSVEFEGDLTFSHLTDFIEGFAFSTAVNSDTVFKGVDVELTTDDGYVIPSATAAQAAKFQYGAVTGPFSLVYARGYVNAANNGIKELDVDLASTDLKIAVEGTLVAETAPTNAEVALAGIRAETGDLALAVASGVGTLTSGNGTPANAIDFTTLGLTVGQMIHVGGLTSTNQFGSTAAADGTRSLGYGRVTSIAAGTLLLDKLSTLLVASDGTDDGSAGTEVEVDLLFGRFIRNVAVDDAEFLERTFQFEGAYADLDSVGVDEYEYAIGNLCNAVSFSLPLTDKAGATFGFVGQDTETPTTTRKTNGANGITPGQTAALNTSSDLARLRIAQVDETVITSDFKSLTFTINNNVTPEKVLGFLGSRFINAGNLEIDIEAQVLFSDNAITTAIRNNETLSMDFILTGDDGGLAVDIPSMTLGGGDREFPVNESILANLQGEAFGDATLDTSFGVSLFPTIPQSA